MPILHLHVLMMALVVTSDDRQGTLRFCLDGLLNYSPRPRSKNSDRIVNGSW